jgi:hypothetical protein
MDFACKIRATRLGEFLSFENGFKCILLWPQTFELPFATKKIVVAILTYIGWANSQIHLVTLFIISACVELEKS